MPRAHVVVDLGMGDSGKGTLVDALCRRHGVKLVIRHSGGCQCAHNVITDEGLHHTFSQFGSGTFAGADTVLTKDVLVDPVRLMNEAEVLSLKGVENPMRRISIDENALVITPYHAALNQVRELSRSGGRHGSCGVGIGETARYALDHPETALRIGDLWSPTVMQSKLRAIRMDLWNDAHQFICGCHVDEMETFQSGTMMDALLWRYTQFAKSGVRPLPTWQILSWISCNDTVWEGAQGVLLDEDYGFHPHTTWSRVTLRNATETLAAAGIKDITNVGVLRVYGHRHGPGPFPSEDPAVGSLFAEPHNGTNQWQSSFRTGWFDMVLAKYALRVAGGTSKTIHWQRESSIHQLALTHVDRLAARPTWPIITGYPVSLAEVPAPDDFSKRERLTSALMSVDSENRVCTVVPAEQVPSYITSELGLPLSVLSNGPAYKDKTFL